MSATDGNPRELRSSVTVDTTAGDSRRASQTTTLTPTITSSEDHRAGGKLPFVLRTRIATRWSRRKSHQDTAEESEESLRGPFGLRILHASSEPLVELIFVHGLRGGSIKTWRKGDDHLLFWPKFFLPMDPDFRNASIYSFGYDSDWGSTKHSILDVHDFGNSLLEAMRTSPHLRRHGKNPIVLIGHSMGGLVIKKAYIAAREDQADPEFAERIQSIFFLATPHRGSDYAATLNNILKISGILPPRQYLADIMARSTSTQLINKDFLRYANDLHIFSFYETLRMSLGGLTSGLIVEKSSAILGPEFKSERVQYLDANHRNVCKFDSLDDPNYLRVRDSLSTALDIILQKTRKDKDMTAMADLAALRSFLGVSGAPKNNYPKLEGSCCWIEHREDFQEWLAGEDAKPTFYVMTAQPGAGKSVLAAHVISQLKELNLSCAYHFLLSGHNHGQSLAGLLRSIAYQMASTNAVFRDVLLKLCDDGSTLAKDDARTIWVKIYKKCLFQYWIVDGLDECPQYKDLFTFLKGEEPLFPLRLMITSRVIPDMPRLLRILSPDLAAIEIPHSDTLQDIRAYIGSRADALPVETDKERDELSEKIVAKSGACFLWVRLVLDELETVYGFQSIMDILEGIPEGMVPYYQRATDLMRKKRETEKRIAHVILSWVLASARPLHTTELAEALDLDSKETKLQQSVKSAIEGLCSYLVQVNDGNFVQLVHLTAREFLLSDEAKEFQVVRSTAHERIAATCLRLLSAPGLRPPRHRRLLHQKRPHPSPFLDYSAMHFSHHVYSASSETDRLILALQSFLKTNVQVWIEHVARKGDLNCLLETARNFRGYLDRRVKYEPPISMPVKTISDWSVDLTRLVTRLGSTLLSSPSSIYFLIPPMAPTTSAIYTQFSKSPPDGLSLVGYENLAWDDCLANVGLDGETATTLACGQKTIAIGSVSGQVALYHHQNFQKQQVLNHGSLIDRVHYDRTGKLLVSSSRKRLAVWDMKGQIQWDTNLSRSLVLLDSSQDYILGLTTHGHFLTWSSSDGSLVKDQPYPYRTPQDEVGGKKRLNRSPSLAALSPDMEFLAISYMAEPICLWYCPTQDFIGFAVDERGAHPMRIIFNPNPQICMFLVAYRDCSLSLFDSFSGERMLSTVGDQFRQVGLLSVTVSLDGRTIASVDRHGLLTIRDFETLSLLYYVSSPDSMTRTIRFSLDSLSLVDVAETSMRVWSPSAMNRKITDEGASISDHAVELPPVEGQFEALRAARLVATCAHPTLPLIAVATHGGEMITYSSKTGKEIASLYSHQKGSCVTALALSHDSLIASGDTYGHVFVYALDTTSPANIKIGTVKLQAQVNKTVRNIFFIPDSDLLFVSTADYDRIFSLKYNTCVGQLKTEATRGYWQWILDHGDAMRKPRLFLVHNKTLKQYNITSFPKRTAEADIHLDYDIDKGIEETDIVLASIHNDTLVLDTRLRQGYAETCCPLLFDLQKVEIRNSGSFISLLPLTSRLAHKVQCMVVPRPNLKSHEQLLFLSDNHWLSSVPLGKAKVHAATYTRHFPVPNEFTAQDGGSKVLPVQTIDDDIVFVIHGELGIIKNGLKHEDIKSF